MAFVGENLIFQVFFSVLFLPLYSKRLRFPQASYEWVFTWTKLDNLSEYTDIYL